MLSKIKNLLLHCAFVFLFISSACAQSQPDTKAIQEELVKMFPNFKVSEVNPTGIPELYEVVGDSGQIIYYSPKGYLLFGEIWTVTGKSITIERRQALQKKKIEEVFNSIPLDKAIKIGSGDKKVIEITDPTCPYCRIASKELDKYKNITRYVYFLPIHGEDSFKQISHILCSKNVEKAYHEAYSGKLDAQMKTMKITNECKEKTEKILAEHQSLAIKLNVRGTPFFIIDKTPIAGADILLIKNLLEKTNQK